MIKALCGAAVVLLLAASVAGVHDHRSAGEASMVTLAYEHEIPNMPGKSIKGVFVDCSPGASREAHTHLSL
jgi:hypothetical protein